MSFTWEDLINDEHSHIELCKESFKYAGFTFMIDLSSIYDSFPEIELNNLIVDIMWTRNAIKKKHCI
jgi:hypothetical protein